MFSLNRSFRRTALAGIALLAVACGGSPTVTAPASTAPSSAPATQAASSNPTPGVPTASPTATPPAPTPAPSSMPTLPPTQTPPGVSLLLEVTNEGGFIAPSAHLGEVPAVVVGTDGTIYTVDPNATSQTLIPAVVVRDVGTSGAAQILAAMRAAGLDQSSSSGGPGNPDAGVTVFTAEIDGQEIVNRISQGAPGGPGHPGGSPEPAIDLLNRLLDPTETWGASNVSNAAFTPTAYKVYVAPAAATGTTAEWPLAAPLAQFGSPAQPNFGVTDLRAGVVFGDDAATLSGALGDADAGTLVTSAGQTFQVWIRPLLPPELTQ